MDVIARQLEAAYPENATWKLRLLPLHERLVGNLRRVLFVLLGAVLVLLLVACSNVAGLLLARSVLRQPEIALRAALGASRGRIVMHLLIEAVALAVVGSIAGLLLGSWLVRVLKVAGPAELPRFSEIGIDPVVVGFTLLGGCRARSHGRSLSVRGNSASGSPSGRRLASSCACARRRAADDRTGRSPRVRGRARGWCVVSRLPVRSAAVRTGCPLVDCGGTGRVGILAMVGPARQAARVDPAEALRTQ